MNLRIVSMISNTWPTTFWKIKRNLFCLLKFISCFYQTFHFKMMQIWAGKTQRQCVAATIVWPPNITRTRTPKAGANSRPSTLPTNCWPVRMWRLLQAQTRRESFSVSKHRASSTADILKVGFLEVEANIMFTWTTVTEKSLETHMICFASMARLFP